MRWGDNNDSTIRSFPQHRCFICSNHRETEFCEEEISPQNDLGKHREEENSTNSFSLARPLVRGKPSAANRSVFFFSCQATTVVLDSIEQPQCTRCADIVQIYYEISFNLIKIIYE